MEVPVKTDQDKEIIAYNRSDALINRKYAR